MTGLLTFEHSRDGSSASCRRDLASSTDAHSVQLHGTLVYGPTFLSVILASCIRVPKCISIVARSGLNSRL